jgi:hypothetical protein
MSYAFISKNNLVIRLSGGGPPAEGHAGKGELPGDAVTAIDDICGAIRDDHLRGCRSGCPRTGSTTGAEEDESGLRSWPLPAGPKTAGVCERRGGQEELSTV